jgi:hypothetical protein
MIIAAGSGALGLAAACLVPACAGDQPEPEDQTEGWRSWKRGHRRHGKQAESASDGALQTQKIEGSPEKFKAAGAPAEASQTPPTGPDSAWQITNRSAKEHFDKKNFEQAIVAYEEEAQILIQMIADQTGSAKAEHLAKAYSNCALARTKLKLGAQPTTPKSPKSPKSPNGQEESTPVDPANAPLSLQIIDDCNKSLDTLVDPNLLATRRAYKLRSEELNEIAVLLQRQNEAPAALAAWEHAFVDCLTAGGAMKLRHEDLKAAEKRRNNLDMEKLDKLQQGYVKHVVSIEAKNWTSQQEGKKKSLLGALIKCGSFKDKPAAEFVDDDEAEAMKAQVFEFPVKVKTGVLEFIKGTRPATEQADLEGAWYAQLALYADMPFVAEDADYQGLLQKCEQARDLVEASDFSIGLQRWEEVSRLAYDIREKWVGGGDKRDAKKGKGYDNKWLRLAAITPIAADACTMCGILYEAQEIFSCNIALKKRRFEHARNAYERAAVMLKPVKQIEEKLLKQPTLDKMWKCAKTWALGRRGACLGMVSDESVAQARAEMMKAEAKGKTPSWFKQLQQGAKADLEDALKFQPWHSDILLTLAKIEFQEILEAQLAVGQDMQSQMKAQRDVAAHHEKCKAYLDEACKSTGSVLAYVMKAQLAIEATQSVDMTACEVVLAECESKFETAMEVAEFRAKIYSHFDKEKGATYVEQALRQYETSPVSSGYLEMLKQAGASEIVLERLAAETPNAVTDGNLASVLVPRIAKVLETVDACGKIGYEAMACRRTTPPPPPPPPFSPQITANLPTIHRPTANLSAGVGARDPEGGALRGAGGAAVEAYRYHDAAHRRRAAHPGAVLQAGRPAVQPAEP